MVRLVDVTASPGQKTKQKHAYWAVHRGLMYFLKKIMVCAGLNLGVYGVRGGECLLGGLQIAAQLVSAGGVSAACGPVAASSPCARRTGWSVVDLPGGRRGDRGRDRVQSDRVRGRFPPAAFRAPLRVPAPTCVLVCAYA